MGNCTSNGNPNVSLTLVYKSIQKKCYRIPKSLIELETFAKQNFKNLRTQKLCFHADGKIMKRDKDLITLQNKNPKMVCEIEIETTDMTSNYNSSCFSIRQDKTVFKSFLTNLNIVMTTTKAISTPDAALKAKIGIELDPKKFFYRSQALCFTLIGTKTNKDIKVLPMVSINIKDDERAYIDNYIVTLKNVDPYRFTYSCKAAPGTPIIKDEKVVGMHISVDSGLKMQAVISELQLVSRMHFFSSEIDFLLSQVVFHDDYPSLMTRFHMIYSLNVGGLSSFNVVKNEFKNFILPLNKNTKLAQALSGVYLLGGVKNSLPDDSVHYFDSYTQALTQKPNMLLPRHSHAVAASELFVYAISGYASIGLTRDCEVYDIKSNK